MDIGSTITAYNGLKAVKEIFSSIKELQNETEVLEKLNEAAKYVGDAQDTLFEIRDELFKLQEENKALRQEVENYENWKGRIKDYELSDTNGGATVYKYKGSPTHFVCTNCIEDKSLQILQDDRNTAGTYSCPKCKTDFNIILKEKKNTSTYLLRS